MNQEIKDKLEQAATNDTGGYYEQQAFVRGAQYVIDNPEQYGLSRVTTAHNTLVESVRELTKENERLLGLFRSINGIQAFIEDTKMRQLMGSTLTKAFKHEQKKPCYNLEGFPGYQS